VSLHILVLAGGSGTRLWPLSRAARPKHLLPLGRDGATLLRDTVLRVTGLGETVHVVTEAAQAESCAAELHDLLPAGAIIAEPVARGTGPALALATHLIAQLDPDALVASVHADHWVGDDNAYRAAVLASAGWARSTGGLSTVGLTPRHASSGFGYVEMGDALAPAEWQAPDQSDRGLIEMAGALPAHRAVRLVEKPPADEAAAFVESGRFLWNLGLFAWPAPAFLDALRAADPAIAAVVVATVAARNKADDAAAARAYGGLRAVPVEPLVFERLTTFTVVRAAFAFSDLGSWTDLHELGVASGGADPAGNVAAGDVLVIGGRDCTVEARAARLVAVVGAEGLVVVDTPDALLVVPAAESQRVREVVDRLRAAGRADLL
jgi:mannose-1-phosphate guanylyltransferase